MTNRVTFDASSGEMMEPKGSGRAPGVLLIQEYWGVNDHIRSLLKRLADAGFVSLAPDLYHGAVAMNAGEAGAMMKALDRSKAAREIGAAAIYLAAHPRCNGRVGIMGFCMGGALTLAAATHISTFGAVVPFYGLPPFDSVDWSKMCAPVMAHFATRDQWATIAGAKMVEAELTKHGKSMALHVYDADHAFVNDTRPEAYAAAPAKLAWERTIEFLHAQLD